MRGTASKHALRGFSRRQSCWSEQWQPCRQLEKDKDDPTFLASATFSAYIFFCFLFSSRAASFFFLSSSFFFSLAKRFSFCSLVSSRLLPFLLFFFLRDFAFSPCFSPGFPFDFDSWSKDFGKKRRTGSKPPMSFSYASSACSPRTRRCQHRGHSSHSQVGSPLSRSPTPNPTPSKA